MTARYRIRPAQAGDVDAIFRIRTGVVENHLSRSELAELGITPETITAMIEAAPCAWLADTQEGAAGFAMVDLAEGELFALFVLPEHEGQGIGRALLAEAEAALFARHPTIRLETAAQSCAAAFYRRTGWIHDGDPESGDIRMTKSSAFS